MTPNRLLLRRLRLPYPRPVWYGLAVLLRWGRRSQRRPARGTNRFDRQIERRQSQNRVLLLALCPGVREHRHRLACSPTKRRHSATDSLSPSLSLRVLSNFVQHSRQCSSPRRLEQGNGPGLVHNPSGGCCRSNTPRWKHGRQTNHSGYPLP